jgi:hypothetical protein
LLVATLGLGLILAYLLFVIWASGSHGGVIPPLSGAWLLRLVAATFAFNFYRIIRTGSVRLGRGGGGPVITREDNPAVYWTVTSIAGFFTALVIFFAIFPSPDPPRHRVTWQTNQAEMIIPS